MPAPLAWGSQQDRSASVTLGMGAALSLPAAATACVPKVIPVTLEWWEGATHHGDKPSWLHKPWGGG